ncbi:hypothetical protein QUF80_09485 [Desulfococcaceae bacterium HSG8]|nr:hypothetical protein [Desulfococcaceae bacterium HSG8]
MFFAAQISDKQQKAPKRPPRFSKYRQKKTRGGAALIVVIRADSSRDHLCKHFLKIADIPAADCVRY